MNLTVDPHVKALIFDIDGTLVDTMPAHFKSWQRLPKLMVSNTRNHFF